MTDSKPAEIKSQKTVWELTATLKNDFSLADLTRLTGAKRRTVQLWAEAGAIKARRSTERAGTGTHRRFSRDEATVACLLNAFAQRQIAIGELIDVADAMRRVLKNESMKALVECVILGQAEGFLIVTFWQSEKGRMWSAYIFDLQGLTKKSFLGSTGKEVGWGILNSFAHLNKPDSISMVVNLKTYLHRDFEA